MSIGVFCKRVLLPMPLCGTRLDIILLCFYENGKIYRGNGCLILRIKISDTVISYFLFIFCTLSFS